MKKNDSLKLPAVGASSLLVMFVVLALAVFAVLSMATVSADRRLSESSLNASLSYLSADSACEMLLAEIRSGELPSGVEKNGNIYSYSRQVSETQSLFVEVEVSGSEYKILKWKLEATQKWIPDDDLPVWDGE